MDELIAEIRIGPIVTEQQKEIALREMEAKLNQIIRVLNETLTPSS